MTSLLFLLTFGVASAQTYVELFAGMDGEMELDNGEDLLYWGYGYTSDNRLTFPAPTLRFSVGETATIAMINASIEAHTIHLHGLDVDQMNDGVPHTSANIVPNDTGYYTFTSVHPGTYFYHCHVTTTLHLTMGMYGALIIEYPNNEITEGVSYDKDYLFQASDLEIETNANPMAAFPFHEIRTDYFMLNGLSGSQLTDDSDQYIWYENGETVLLRLCNLGYTRVVYNLPAELNAVVHTSDGRLLPAPFEAESLEVYPGERFSVLVSPPAGFEGSLEADYFSLLNGEYRFTNSVPFQEGINPTINETPLTGFAVYPNPASNVVRIEREGTAVCTVQVKSLTGEHIARLDSDCSGKFAVDRLATGVYLLHDENGLFISRLMLQ